MNTLGNDKDVEELTKHLLHFFMSKGTGSLDDAWDAVQETLLRVLTAMTKEDIKSTEGYAIGVAKNVKFEQLRRIVKAKRHDPIDDMAFVSFRHTETPEHVAIRHDMLDKMHQGMTKLPGHMQDVLTERFIKEVPSKSIAERLGKHHSTVDLRVYRAKRKLRKMVL